MSPRPVLVLIALLSGVMAPALTLSGASAQAPSASIAPMSSGAPARLPGPSATPSPSLALLPCPSLEPSASPADADLPGVSSPEASLAATALVSNQPSTAPSPVASGDPCVPVNGKLGMGLGGAHLVLRGGETGGSFVVANSGDVPMNVTTAKFNFTVDSTGKHVQTTEIVPLGAANWISLLPWTFTLQPGESRKVLFSVARPSDAGPGDHYAGIRVIGSTTNDAYAAIESVSSAHFTMRSKIEFPLTVVARVDGVVNPDVLVPGFEVFLPSLVTTMNGTFTFVPEIENKGNIAAVWSPQSGPGQQLNQIVPTLSLQSTGGLFAKDALLFEGKTDADGKVNLSPLVILPGASHTQSLTLTDAPIFGTFNYTYKLPGNLGDGRADIIKTGSFTIINLQKVLYWIVLPLIVLLVLISITLIGRRRRTLQRRTAEALRMRDLQKARLEGYEQAWHDQMAAQGRRPRG
ncbi:MAG: hypothetical protein U0869_16930 [Chloroflexota bacterium]